MSGGLLQLGRPVGLGLRSLWRHGLQFLYPPACVFCQVDLDDSDHCWNRAAPLCDECHATLTPEETPICLRCGAPVGPHLDSTNGCIRCKRDRFAFERVIRLGVYEDKLRQACLQAQQFSGEPLLAALTALLWDLRDDSLQQANFDLVVSVPQFCLNRLWRTHNPSGVIADELARRLQVPHRRRLLYKTRMTPPQTGLPPADRRKNLRNAFAVRSPRQVRDRSVLLVDDILTTGSTAHQLARVLKKAGARRIWVAVLARGLGHGRGV